jgi:hypothetical protein
MELPITSWVMADTRSGLLAGFCPGLTTCFNQISWSDSKLLRLSGGFFAEWWSGLTSSLGRTANFAHFYPLKGQRKWQYIQSI